MKSESRPFRTASITKSRNYSNRNKNKPNFPNRKNNFYKPKSVNLSRKTLIYKTNWTNMTIAIEDWKMSMRSWRLSMIIWKEDTIKDNQTQKKHNKNWSSRYKVWRHNFSSYTFRLKNSAKSRYKQKISRYRL